MEKFPFFVKKSSDSNFYKSEYVFNEQFKDLYNDSFQVYESFHIHKRLFVWKEQSEAYEYTVNFVANYPFLKKVNIYKNNVRIYTKSYTYDEAADTFFYSYDGESNKIIPSDKYHITVETYEEYTLSKGFPENDTLVGDIYDHDQSLDELGALYDIPRKTYVYPKDVNYENTEPPYNNRATEDDYHYMNRILGYIANMRDTPLPVLEIWKLYGIPLSEISLINRERYLCKMYSSEKHGGDDWSPFPWEHKDTMGCFWPEPIFFFVNVDNESPVYGQKIHFSFTFMNMYGEEHNEGYLIDAYLDGELISEGIDPKTIFEFDTTGADDSHPLVFKFIANPIDERYEILESDELYVIIKGCNTADWFVAVDGSDSNDGSIDHPFKTLDKALSMVEGSRNVITLKQGTFHITHEELIDTPTSIISCQGAIIRNDNNYDFFRIMQDCSLYLMGITLKHKCCEMYGEDTTFQNHNVTENPVFLRINPEIMCKPPVSIVVDDIVDKIYAHTEFSVDGTLYDANNNTPIAGEIIDLMYKGQVLATDTTDSNGEYSFTRKINTIGTKDFVLNHEESEDYCMGETSFFIVVEAMPSTLTCAMDSTVLFGDELTLAYDLVDYYGDDITVGYVVLLEGTTVLAAVEAGETIHYTPETIGEHNYHLQWAYDSTYVQSETEPVTVNVRRFETILSASSTATQYTVGESVTVNGVLTDELGNVLGGQTVRLYDGDTLISTKTTNDDGEVSYTSSNLSLGVHSFTWKFTATGKYNGTDSNVFRLRIVPLAPEIKLTLSFNGSGSISGGTIPLKVYATDENDDPISTSFKLVDAGSIECGQYPSTSYTTGNDGYWTGTYSSSVLIACGVLYLQAVDSTDEYIVSNVLDVYSTGRYSSSITMVRSKSPVAVGESFTLSGVLTTEEVTGAEVKIMRGSTLLDTVTVDNTGAYSYVNSESLAGTYSYKAVYNGDRLHEPCESSAVSVKVSNGMEVLASNLTKYDGGSERFVVTVVEDGSPLGGKNVTIILDGNSFSRTTDSNGECSIPVNKAPGTYPVSVTCEEITINRTITVLPIVIASDVSKYEHGVESFVATILDTTGEPVEAGTSVDVNIESTFTAYTTDNTGKITVPLNQAPDEYILTVHYGSNYAYTIEVLPRLIASDLTKRYKCSEQYIVEVLDSTGAHVPDGTQVTFNIHGVSYVRTTVNGYIQLNINLPPDTYTITVDYDNLTTLTNTITVLPKLTANDLVKNWGDGSQFVANLVDCTGLPDSDESITFNIQGVVYPRTTDNNGQAKLNINLQPSTYLITSSTSKNEVIQNTITVNPPTGLSFTSSVDKQTITPGENCIFQALLKKNNVPLSGETIEYEITSNGSVLDSGSFTTGSSGGGSVVYTGTGAGTVTCTFSWGSQSTSKSVDDSSHSYSLGVTGTKSILSYADGESCTVTATLTDGGVAVAGETLSYVIKHGSTIISTGSDTTDNNGEISITYTSTGIGDITVEVDFGILLQERYDVIDYVSYDGATTDKASKYTIANLNSHTFSTDHYVAERTLSASASATYYSLVHETYNLPTDFEASVDLLVTNKSTSDHQFGLCISPDYPETYSGTNQCFLYSNRNRFALGYRINGSLSNYGAYNSDFSTNTWYTFYIKVQGTTVTTTIKQGSNTIQSYTGTHSNIQSWKKLMLVIGGNSNNMHWKNLKIKAL